MVVAVLCLAWLVVSLPLGVLLGHALRRSGAADRPERGRAAVRAPAGAPARLPLPLG
jgi:hypothetical protein